jgi:DNA-binding HxlR family transcriptional regulator
MKFVPMKEVLRPPIRSKKPVNHEQKDHSCSSVDHKQRLLGMNDAMEVLSGKWKIQLIGTLIFGGKMRFMDLLRQVNGIAAKMLSKELQDLESHQLITRTVLQTKPITVEYEITPYGKSLRPIIIEITDWGMNHRKEIMKG